MPRLSRPASPSRRPGGLASWALLLVAALVLGGGWWGYQKFSGPDLRALAAATGPDDVVMYVTSTCPYCKQAAAWLEHHEIPYTACNVETDRGCLRAYTAYRAQGVPFLVVKGAPLSEGFDEDEIVAALAAEAPPRGEVQGGGGPG